ncbi:MAG TPA: metalloregulator ArsR/SmtB family transcription factor [Solirubrobacteraceae bacterium]|nr:metalloregulator ArsR/SmtB family transcription factor [Solirubrobacteraceae bacterium]
MITESERAEVASCETGELELAAVLHALSDPIRLRIVTELSDGVERSCGAFNLPITKSTCSHHFRVLREAGVISTRVEGKSRINVLRRDPLDERFPGLLDAVLQARSD